jgi:hypothetical protein
VTFTRVSSIAGGDDFERQGTPSKEFRMIRRLVALVYVVVGVVVANSHHYFTHAGTLKGVVSAILAVLLWPLVLGGVNLHLGKVLKK